MAREKRNKQSSCGYVLVREDGKFVTPPGSHRSYTGKLQEARVFATREAAERERCVGNETCVPLNACFG